MIPTTMTRAFAVLLLAALPLAAFGQPPRHRERHDASKIDYFYRLLPPDAPQRVGQAALGAIQEAVGLLLADPATDWSRVSIARLRQHLVDLDAVILRSRVEETPVDGGLEILVDGDPEVLEAARRVIPSHLAVVEGFRAWRVELLDSTAGADASAPLRLRMIAPDEGEVEVVRALGFFGFLASGIYRPGYHLALARGVSE